MSQQAPQLKQEAEDVAPSSFLHMDWPDTPWVKMCRLSNSFAYDIDDPPLTMEEKRKKIDELMATAVDEGAAYMKQTPNHLLDGAEEAMHTQYSHLPDYGLFTEAEADALFEKKLEQIRSDPLGMMEFFKPSYDAWGNPAYVVAFYVAIQQKLLRADQVVYDVSLYYTSKQFSAPVDSDDEDEATDEDNEKKDYPTISERVEYIKTIYDQQLEINKLRADMRLAAAPAATTGTVVHQEVAARAAKKQKKN